MTELLSLYRQAEQLNIPVYHLPLPETGSMSLMGEDGRCRIGMDAQHNLTENAQRVRLAHELGHCVTGSFYNRCSPYDVCRAHENRADRYAVQRLIPAEELNRAVAEGVTDLWELADRFGVDVPFMQKAVCLYTHGNLATELYF